MTRRHHSGPARRVLMLLLCVSVLAQSLALVPTAQAAIIGPLTNPTQVLSGVTLVLSFKNIDGTARVIQSATLTDTTSLMDLNMTVDDPLAFRVIYDTTWLNNKAWTLPSYSITLDGGVSWAPLAPRAISAGQEVVITADMLASSNRIGVRAVEGGVAWSISHVQNSVRSIGLGTANSIQLLRAEPLWWTTNAWIPGAYASSVSTTTSGPYSSLGFQTSSRTDTTRGSENSIEWNNTATTRTIIVGSLAWTNTTYFNETLTNGRLTITLDPAHGKGNYGSEIRLNKAWLNATLGITRPQVVWAHAGTPWKVLPLTDTGANWSATPENYSTITINQVGTGETTGYIREGTGGTDVVITRGTLRTLGTNNEENRFSTAPSASLTNPVYKIPVSDNANSASRVYVVGQSDATSVGNLGSVTSGTYYYDSANKLVYVGGPSIGTSGNDDICTNSVSNCNAYGGNMWNGTAFGRDSAVGTITSICLSSTSTGSRTVHLRSSLLGEDLATATLTLTNTDGSTKDCTSVKIRWYESRIYFVFLPTEPEVGTHSSQCNTANNGECWRFTGGGACHAGAWQWYSDCSSGPNIQYSMSLNGTGPDGGGSQAITTAVATMLWGATFNITVPGYVDTGQPIIAQGIIRGVDGLPLDGYEARMRIKNTDGTGIPCVGSFCPGEGPAYNTSFGNYLAIMASSYIAPNSYNVEITFTKAATTITKTWPIVIGRNSLVGGPLPIYSDGALNYNFYDAASGTGLNKDFYRVYVSSDSILDETDRTKDSRLGVVVGTTVYVQVKDYFDHVVFPQAGYVCNGGGNQPCPFTTVVTGSYAALPITRSEVFADVGVTLYQTKIKNTQTSPSYVTMTANSKTYQTWVLPGEVVTLRVPADTYSFTQTMYDENLQPPQPVDYAYNYSTSALPNWRATSPDANATGVISSVTTLCSVITCTGQPNSTGSANGAIGAGAACLDYVQSSANWCARTGAGQNTTLYYFGTLDLNRVAKLTNLTLSLYDPDARSHYGWRVEVSADPVTDGWKYLYDSTQNSCDGGANAQLGVVRTGTTTTASTACSANTRVYKANQTLTFNATDVRYIRVFCTGTTTSTDCQLNELRAGASASATIIVDRDQFVWIRGYDIYSVVFAINNANAIIHDQQVNVGIHIRNNDSTILNQTTSIEQIVTNTQTVIVAQNNNVSQTVLNTESNLTSVVNKISQKVTTLNIDSLFNPEAASAASGPTVGDYASPSVVFPTFTLGRWAAFSGGLVLTLAAIPATRALIPPFLRVPGPRLVMLFVGIITIALAYLTAPVG